MTRSARRRATILGALLAATILAAPAGAATDGGALGQAYSGDGYGWLLAPEADATRGAAQDAAALAAVAQLMRDRDPRAGLALQNYIGRHPDDAAAFDLAGVSLMRDGQWAEAALAFARASSFQPGNAWFRAKLGAAQVMAGRDGPARNALDDALQLDPDNPIALRHLALLAVRAGDLSQAVIQSERALAAFGLPRDAVNQAHFDLAELYLRQGRPGDVLALLRPAMERDAARPDDTQRELLGRVLDAAMAVGEVDLARRAMDGLAPLIDPQAPGARVAAARLAAMSGDPDGALALLDALIADEPAMAPALQGERAEMLAAAGRPAEAASLLRDVAATLAPDAGIPVLDRALVLEAGADGAIAARARIAGLRAAHPGRADLRALEIDVLARTGDVPAARLAAEAMVAERPDDAAAQRRLGTLAVAQGDRDAGLAALRRALDLDPHVPEAWLLYLGTLHGHDSYTGADSPGAAAHGTIEAVLEEAIAANPAAPELHEELGLLRLSDGRPEAALTAFEEGLRHAPGHLGNLALAALAQADLGTRPDLAVARAEAAHAARPDAPIHQDILGWARLRAGDAAGGVPLMERAATAEPDDAIVQYHLAVASQEAGDTDAALARLRASLAGGMYAHNADDARARLLALDPSDDVTTQIRRIDGAGVHDAVGTLTLMQDGDVLRVRVEAGGLPPGANAAHVHVFGTCAPSTDGRVGAMAGGHFGHGGHHGDHHGGGAAGGMAGHAMPAPAADAPMPDAGMAMDHGAMDHGAMASATMVHGAMATNGAGDGMASMPSGGAPAEDPAMTPDAAPATGDAMPPRGDLPPIDTAADGRTDVEVVSTRLTLDEIRGRALMIHAGPDQGGVSGPKIACAIIP